MMPRFVYTQLAYRFHVHQANLRTVRFLFSITMLVYMEKENLHLLIVAGYISYCIVDCNGT